jgi:guanylate kinase
MLVVCGPSGAGKSTLTQHLLAQRQRLRFSISCTSRAARGRERDGVEYHFVERPRFDAMLAAGEFAEWADVHGNRYGTTHAAIDTALEAGFDVLFDIDYQGARQLRAAFPGLWVVLVSPPSLEVLAARLRARGTDDEVVIQRRLNIAQEELEQEGLYDFVIHNDQLERAQAAILSIYDALCLRSDRACFEKHGS